MPNETENIAGRVESDGVYSSVRMFQFGNYHESLRREKAPCYWPRGDPNWFRSRRAEFSFDAWSSTEEVIAEGDVSSWSVVAPLGQAQGRRDSELSQARKVLAA